MSIRKAASAGCDCIGAAGSWAQVKAIWGGKLTASRATGQSVYFMAGFEVTSADGTSVPETPALFGEFTRKPGWKGEKRMASGLVPPLW